MPETSSPKARSTLPALADVERRHAKRQQPSRTTRSRSRRSRYSSHEEPTDRSRSSVRGSMSAAMAAARDARQRLRIARACEPREHDRVDADADRRATRRRPPTRPASRRSDRTAWRRSVNGRPSHRRGSHAVQRRTSPWTANRCAAPPCTGSTDAPATIRTASVAHRRCVQLRAQASQTDSARLNAR